MNITSLQTFITIVDTGSLIRASEQLNVTQSTVTARLKTLEDALGQVLLNRLKSGVTLTPAGTRLLHYARIMTGLWRQAQREAGLPSGLMSTCTLGCHPELWHGPGKTFFHNVLADQNDMAMTLHQGTSTELDSWLAEGMVDVIITFDAVSRRDQTIHTLPTEDIALYSSHPDTPITQDPNYVFADYGEAFRRFHAETYFDAGVARINMDSATCTLEYLVECGGSAYLPRSLAQPHVANRTLFDLPDAPIFHRARYLVVSDRVAKNWPWFKGAVETLGTCTSKL